MKLGHLVSLRRYKRCRQIFSNPLKAHVQTAAARQQRVSLRLVEGSLLDVHDLRKSRRTFNWLLKESHDPLPVTTENGLVLFRHQGLRIALRPISTDFFTFEEVVVRDVYRINQLEEPLSDVIDIGANVGLFAIRIAPIARRVICVEPVEENISIAKRNAVLARVESKIHFHNCAITDNSGQTVRLYLSADNYGGHSVSQDHAAQWGQTACQEVPTISLADLFDREGVRRCSLLKCDAEGSEFSIIRAASSQILSRIGRIAMEVHLTTSSWGENEFHRLTAKLRDAGFSIEHEPLHDRNGNLNHSIMLFATNMRSP